MLNYLKRLNIFYKITELNIGFLFYHSIHKYAVKILAREVSSPSKYYDWWESSYMEGSYSCNNLNRIPTLVFLLYRYYYKFCYWNAYLSFSG